MHFHVAPNRDVPAFARAHVDAGSGSVSATWAGRVFEGAQPFESVGVLYDVHDERGDDGPHKQACEENTEHAPAHRYASLQRFLGHYSPGVRDRTNVARVCKFMKLF